MDKYNQFLEKCVFIEYDDSKTEICEALLKDNITTEICRNLINEERVEEILKNKETNGYIAKVDDKYIGFIFFNQKYDSFYLSLIATKPKLGFPLGQMLLAKMEEEAKIRKVRVIQGDAIPQAVSFYEKMNYEVKYMDEYSGEFFIQKNL